MGRCIVKNCPNKKNRCSGLVSFFNLPKSDQIRNSWFEKIGEVILPPNIQNAKICSAHFTDESFLIGRRQKSGKCKNARRLLLSNAFPTIMFSSTENRTDTINMNFKIIRKKFLLPTNVHKNTDEGSSTANNSRSIEVDRQIEQCGKIVEESLRSENASPDPSSASETVVNIETSKSHVRREGENKTICEMPKSTFHASDNVYDTFPIRSQKIKRHNHRSIVSSGYKQIEKRQRHVKNLKMSPRKILGECHSEESTPSCSRTQRFLIENCSNITESTYKTKQNEEPSTSMSRCNYLDEMKQYEKEYQMKALRSQLAQKNEEIQNMIKEKEQMQVTINDLQAKLAIADLDKRNLEKTTENKMIETLQRYFTEGQIRCILENRKWIQWSVDDYASAILFYSISQEAYRYFRLKLNFPLPSLASLRKWVLRKFDTQEGFLFDVLTVMREKCKTFTSLEKITVLTFDEMALSHEVQFNLKIEELVEFCGKVQMIMARGLFGNWKQPIYYKFGQSMTKDILMEAICHLHDAGYEVVATTSDMENKGVWSELQITPDNYFFQHPRLKDGKVFVFADILHLLKLLRNWFVDEGFLLENCNTLFTAEIMQAIIDTGNQGDLRVAHRLTQRMLDARHSMRQAVKPAAQMWSHTVAKAIKWAGDSKLINVPHYQEFSDFVFAVNKWFDVHNSQQKYGVHPGVNGFGMNINDQEIILILMNIYIQNMKVGSRKSLMPFQNDILISNASLRTLYNYLKSKYPQEFEYISTRRLQQDVLENFFTYIRAIGSCKDHPTEYEFRYRLRRYILGKCSHAVFPINRNTENVETSCLFSSIVSESSSTLLKVPSPIVASNIASTSNITSLPAASIPKRSSTYKTSANICEFTDIHSNSENENHLQDEIILTKELFSNIINISPEQLEEDSAHNDDDLEKYMDDGDIDPFIFESDCTELYTLCSENTASDIVQEAGSKYIAGYVAHRFKKKYPHLGKPINTVIDDSTDVNWIQCVSKGYLIYPSDELMHISKIVEKCFKDFHGYYFSQENFVIQKVIALVKENVKYHPCIPDEVLQCLVRTRTYIQIRKIKSNMCKMKKEEKKK